MALKNSRRTFIKTSVLATIASTSSYSFSRDLYDDQIIGRPAPSPVPIESTDVRKLLGCHAFEMLLCQISSKKQGTSKSVNTS